MKFWKDHAALRIVLMIMFFVVGLALVLYGWSLTGEMAGLVLMLIGIVLMLTTLLIYNQRFTSRSR